MRRLLLGEEHFETLTSPGDLATSLSGQAKHAEAENTPRIFPRNFEQVEAPSQWTCAELSGRWHWHWPGKNNRQGRPSGRYEQIAFRVSYSWSRDHWQLAL